MKTLLLTQDAWDLCLDATGNIAVASDPYSVAQDVASRVKLFAGELWYDTTQGIPYFGEILGQFPPVEFMRAQFIAAALQVPEVVSAECYFTAITDRKLSGQIQFTTSSGVTLATSF